MMIVAAVIAYIVKFAFDGGFAHVPGVTG